MRPVVFIIAILAGLGSAQALASPASDAFGRCLVQSSTGKDRVVFMQWLFSALSANPDVAPLTNISAERRAQLSAQAAEVMQRLVLQDCHDLAVTAVRSDGDEALSTSFELFGKAAAQDLMTDPAVTKEMGAMSTHLDQDRWTALIDEAKKAR